jgi:hypothetical protein
MGESSCKWRTRAPCGHSTVSISGIWGASARVENSSQQQDLVSRDSEGRLPQFRASHGAHDVRRTAHLALPRRRAPQLCRLRGNLDVQDRLGSRNHVEDSRRGKLFRAFCSMSRKYRIIRVSLFAHQSYQLAQWIMPVHTVGRTSLPKVEVGKHSVLLTRACVRGGVWGRTRTDGTCRLART